MDIYKELLNVKDNKLYFGMPQAEDKQKVDGFKFNGGTYKVKSHNQITSLHRDGKLLYESIPGTRVSDFDLDDSKVSFSVEANSPDVMLTLELEPDKEYKIYANQVQVGKTKTNLSGKISFGLEFSTNKQEILIQKIN